jgi:hypothetical protein
VAEWLRSGLQSRLRGFDSPRRLYTFHKKGPEKVPKCDPYTPGAGLAVLRLFGCGNEIYRAHAERLGDALHCAPARGRLARFRARQRAGGDPGFVREIFLREALLAAQALDGAAEIRRGHVGNISIACVQVHAILRMRQTCYLLGAGDHPHKVAPGKAGHRVSWFGARPLVRQTAPDSAKIAATSAARSGESGADCSGLRSGCSSAATRAARLAQARYSWRSRGVLKVGMLSPLFWEGKRIAFR